MKKFQNHRFNQLAFFPKEMNKNWTESLRDEKQN